MPNTSETGTKHKSGGAPGIPTTLFQGSAQRGMRMSKFILGVILGSLLAVGYVRFGWELPEFLQLSDRLHGNMVSTAIEFDLYDLNASEEKRRRALEVFFSSRPRDAVALDAAAGHPYLDALYRTRAAREARQLKLQGAAIDKTLAQPAMRAVLEREHGTTDTVRLKQEILLESLSRYPFLNEWLRAEKRAVTVETLDSVLSEVAAIH